MARRTSWRPPSFLLPGAWLFFATLDKPARARTWVVAPSRVKSGGGFDFDAGYRDVLHLGDCDDGCRRLAALLG
jgi:hypothetical protein